ncbi:MAG: hypothetical protein RIC55_04435 [Pirellulaceae bacterium]
MSKVSQVVLAWMVIAVCGATAVAQNSEDFAAGLKGRWKSDWQRTKKHIDADCKLTDDQLSALRQLVGKMTVQYDDKHVVHSMPEIRFRGKDGSEIVMDAWTTTEPLEVLGRTKMQIAFRNQAIEPLTDDSIGLLTFDDDDTYWVYMAGFHVREYFRRVPAETGKQ